MDLRHSCGSDLHQHQRRVENDVTIVTKYANGATGSFITCTHDAIGTDRLEIDFDGGKIVVENSLKATVYRMAKDGKRVDEKYMNDNIGMMELAMLTRSNGGGGLYEVEEFSNNDAWGVQHGTVMANFASHVLLPAPTASWASAWPTALSCPHGPARPSPTPATRLSTTLS